MAACDVNSAIANVKTMLKNLSAWQTICGVSTADAAAERIHEYGVDEEEDTDTLCPLIILDIESSSLAWQGQHLRGPLVVTCRMELEIPENTRSTYSTQAVWFWEQWSAMLAGISGGVQGSGQLMLDGISTMVKPGRIDPDTNNGRCEWLAMLGLEIHLQ